MNNSTDLLWHGHMCVKHDTKVPNMTGWHDGTIAYLQLGGSLWMLCRLPAMKNSVLLLLDIISFVCFHLVFRSIMNMYIYCFSRDAACRTLILTVGPKWWLANASTQRQRVPRLSNAIIRIKNLLACKTFSNPLAVQNYLVVVLFFRWY